MMIKLCRIGNDVAVRFTASGDAVANISLAYSYGKAVDGKKPSQWIEGSLWGKRAESLAPYLTKGQQAVVTLDDVHIESFESNGQTKTKLAARVVDIQLCGSKPEAQQSQQGVTNNRPANQPASGGFDDFNDDIPFNAYERGMY